VVTAAVHIRGQLVAETGLNQIAEAEVSHHIAEIHADLCLREKADDIIDREGGATRDGKKPLPTADQGVCTPVISARYWKNARLRSEEMPQLTGGD
jgi:hypothetical protein